MEREADLSSTSFVSSISAVSSIHHHPHPPDAPKPTSQGFRAKRSKIVRSPYLVTSTPHSGQRKPSQLSAQKLAPSFSKAKWGSVLRTSGFNPDAWASPPQPSAAHSSSPAFLQTAMKVLPKQGDGAKKRKRSQSSTGVDAAPAERSGDLDALALRDEVVRLRAALREATRERELARALHRRLGQEAARRDKLIEDLLASGHITSRDATRSLAGGNKKAGSEGGVAGSGAVISSLRQQVHSLGRALREKEEAMTKLQRSVAAARLREAELQAETYYREVCRLTKLLEEQSTANGPPGAYREAQVKLKGLDRAVAKLSQQLDDSQAHNAKLKQQLATAHTASPSHDLSSHSERGVRGSIADQYLDLKRSQLLSAIVDLELRVREKDSTVQSLCRDVEERKAHHERRIAALSGDLSDALARGTELQAQVSELEQARDKLHSVVHKLKEDRVHYRTIAEGTQAEIAAVSAQLRSEESSRSEVVAELEGVRERYRQEMLALDHARHLTK